MVRYALAAVAAALLGAPADAQVITSSSYYGSPGITISGGNLLPGGVTISPSTGVTYSPYSSYYSPGYTGYSSYYAPGYSSYYTPGYSSYSGYGYTYPAYSGYSSYYSSPYTGGYYSSSRGFGRRWRW